MTILDTVMLLVYVIGPTMWAQKIANCFSSLLYHNLQIANTNNIKSRITTAEFNGLSSEIYESTIPHLELKILAKI